MREKANAKPKSLSQNNVACSDKAGCMTSLPVSWCLRKGNKSSNHATELLSVRLNISVFSV